MNFSEININSDDLLAKKLAERSSMDKFISNMPHENAAQGTIVTVGSVHATLIQKYLQFTPEEKKRFSVNSPDLYGQIIAALPGQTAVVVSQEKVHTLDQPDTPYTKLYPESDSDTEIEPVAPSKRKQKVNFLSFDFRCDIKDIREQHYVLQMPAKYSKGIVHLELESCILPHLPQLEQESHIYIDITEFDGDYVTSRRKVFGKLLLNQTLGHTGQYLTYIPENCKKSFLTGVNLSQLTVAFYSYDNSPIFLQHLDLANIMKDEKTCGITTKQPHCLCQGDRLTLSTNFGNRVESEIVYVKEVFDKQTCIISVPLMDIGRKSQRLDAMLEKVDLKCTLTFRLRTDG